MQTISITREKLLELDDELLTELVETLDDDDGEDVDPPK